jgi:hypothetical protein
MAAHQPLFYSLKVGVAAGTIYASERLWKKNRAASIALMVAINSAYATLVARNYAVRR